MPRRAARCVLPAAALLALVAVAAPTEAATPAGTLTAAPPATRTLTLVTGDRVVVSGPADARRVSTQPRPGGAAGFEISQHGGDLTVVPRELTPGRYDPRLFDVTDLLAHGYDRTATPVVITGRDGTRRHQRLRAGDRITDAARVQLDRPDPAPAAAAADTVDVHLALTGRDGRPATGLVSILDVEHGAIVARRDPTGPGTCTDAAYSTSDCIALPPGTYSILGLVYTMPPDAPSTVSARTVLNTSLVGTPQLTVDHDLTVPLDARAAVPVRTTTPDHPEATANLGGAQALGFTRTPREGDPVTFRINNSPGAQIDENFYVQPMAPPSIGSLGTFTRLRLEQPQLTLRTLRTPLTPRYYDPVWFSDITSQYPRLSGLRLLRVVDVGTATKAELSGRNLRGALAVVRRSDAIAVADQSNNAAAAGAALVAVYNDGPGTDPSPGAIGIRLRVPTVSLPHEQGVALLAAHEPFVLADGHPASSYLYDLFVRHDGAPARPVFRADGHSLAAVSRTFTSDPGNTYTFSQTGYPFLPGETSSFSTTYARPGGAGTQVDYYVADPGVRWSFSALTPESPYNHLFPEPYSEIALLAPGTTVFGPGERRRERWYGAPMTSGVATRDPLQRNGDVMKVHLNAFVDSAGNGADAYTYGDGISTRFTMYAGDTQLVSTTARASGLIRVPAGSARYRLVYDVDNAAPWAQLSTHTHSEWGFTSATTAAGEIRTEPTIAAGWDVDAGLANTLPAGRSARLGLRLTHQAGAAQPAFTAVTVDVSADDGTSWAPARLSPLGAGRWLASLPVTSHRGGYLTLRLHAADAAGGTLEQTITRAFGVR